jgi:hypothetical protein
VDRRARMLSPIDTTTMCAEIGPSFADRHEGEW